MSIDYSKIQEQICNIGKALPVEEQEEFCPTCLISPTAHTPSDWWNQVEPYLNKKTCEYYIPVNVNAEGKTYTTRELHNVRVPFNIFKYSYLRTGIRRGLRQFNKMEDNQIVCAIRPPNSPAATTYMSNNITSEGVCPHLYADNSLRPFLGRFYTDKELEDKNGNKFKIQELHENLVNRFEQINNHSALELFARVEDYHLGNGYEPIKILVVIPAYIFDQIPLTPIAAALAEQAASDEEGEQDKDYELKTEVEIDAFKFKENIKTLSAAFGMWTTYQAMFFNLQGGRVKIRSLFNKDKDINFYIKNYKKPVALFSEALEKLLVQNDFILTSDKKRKLAAEKIKLTFELPTESKVYRISKVECKYKNCEYEELSSNLEQFLADPRVENPTLLNYVASIEESTLAIRLQKSAPWIDWIQAYTYPRTTVNYAAGVENILDCIEKPADSTEVDDVIFNVDFSFADVLAWFSSQLNCQTLKDMQNYDPIKELDKIKNKFDRLMEGFTWADNNAIRELFGLPINFTDIATSGNPLKKISEFFSRLSLCNISSTLFEILKCLFGTFSLDEMIEAVVTRVLMLAGIPAFELLYKKSPASLQERTREKAVIQLGGFDKTPWEYYEEKLAEEKDLPKYMIWLAGVDEKAAGLGTRRGLGGGENPPEKNVEEVFNEWLKQYMAASEDIDWILEQIKDFPGAEILKLLVATFACPNQHVLKKFMGELRGIINFGALNPCNPLGEKFLTLPAIPKIPKMEWKEILRALLMLLIKKLIDIIANILLGFLLKFLAMLNCDTFKDLLDFLATGNEKALEDAIGESFCDDAEALNNSGALDTMLGLMDDQGLGSNPEDLLPLAADISALAGKNEFKGAFLNTPEEQDPDFCMMICSVVRDRHPKFAPVLGHPDKVGNFFSGIGNFLTPSQREVIAATITEDEVDTPIESSICLTNEQVKKWNADKQAYINNICGDMPMDGATDGISADPDSSTLGEDYLDILNKRKRSNLDEVLDMFIKGPAAGIGEALEEAMQITAPSCNYDPDTGEPLGIDELPPSNSAIPPMPEEVSTAIDNAKKDMYATVDMAFIEDMSAGYHSYFNNLFADTYNFPLHHGKPWRPSHQTAVWMGPWLAPNAFDTKDQWQKEWDSVKEKRISIKKLRMKRTAPDEKYNESSQEWEEIEDHENEVFNTHAFPETIGLWMHSQILEQAGSVTLETDISLKLKAQRMTFSRTYKKRAWKEHKRMEEKIITYDFMRSCLPKEQLVLSYRDNNAGMGGWQYGFDLKMTYPHDSSGNQTKDLSYRIILEELTSKNVSDGSSWKTRNSGSDFVPPENVNSSVDRYFNLAIPISLGNAAEPFSVFSEPSIGLDKYNYPGIVFNNYLTNLYESKGQEFNYNTDKIAKDMFENLNNFVYSRVLSSTLTDPNEPDGIPQSFKFGYVDDEPDDDDKQYVDPDYPGHDPSDPETWGYDRENDEKVMGVSPTGHPRVEWLHPEEHGIGKFTKPKLYIHEPSYTGWMGLSQMIVPEEDNHEPKRKSFIYIDDIVEAEKDLREQIPLDERLNDVKACLQERTYDVLNAPSGHAGLHSTVLMTTRTFVFEHILKTLPIYSILKIDFTKNYDESVLAAIVKDMEEGISDIPVRGTRGGFFKKYNYWLLFLEQSVQTFERLILTDKIEVNDAIADLLTELKELREQSPVFTEKDKKWLKFVKSVTWDSSGGISEIFYAWEQRVGRGKGDKGAFNQKKLTPLTIPPGDEQHNRIKRYMNSIMFNSFGKNFRTILAGETREFSFRMRRRQRYAIKMCNKLYNIHLSQGLAKSCLRYVIADQLNYYSDKLITIADDDEAAYKYKPKPYIDDLRAFFFGSSGNIITPLTAGTMDEMEEYKQKLVDDPEAIYDFGSSVVKDVVHNPLTTSPVDNFSATEKTRLLENSEFGNFYFEKYLRIVEKPVIGLPTTREKKVNDRDFLYKGVVNIKEFQIWMKQNLGVLSQPHDRHLRSPLANSYHTEEDPGHDIRISDLFGNATPIFGEPSPEDVAAAAGTGKDPEPPLIGYNGSTGIRFGVRLCYIPKADYNPDLSLTLGRKEKSFVFPKRFHVDEETEEQVNDYPEHNITRIIPLVSYERDLVDRPIIDLNLEGDNFGENLDCYVEQLLNCPEMNLIFDYCAPIRRASSMLAIYSNYAWMSSIGEDPSERDMLNARAPEDEWKARVLRKTKDRLRDIFVANYKAITWQAYNEKDDPTRDRSKRDFKIHWSLKKPKFGRFGFGGWRFPIEVDRPYDMYGNLEDDDAT